jgi:hypothetical protein
MLVLLDQDGCPFAVDASPLARCLAHIRAWRLDADLASGASPDSSVALALRAQMLVRIRTRRELARGVQRVVSRATGQPTPTRIMVPVSCARIRACTDEFNELIASLLADGPVSAQGMARVRELLTDAGSPLYQSGPTGEMRVAVRAATEALRAS